MVHRKNGPFLLVRDERPLGGRQLPAADSCFVAHSVEFAPEYRVGISAVNVSMVAKVQDGSVFDSLVDTCTYNL